MAGVRIARAYLPGMAQQKWGRFIFLGSESAFNVPPDAIHYGVSKVADVALARGLAKRFAGTGVTINSVLPGPTMTEALHHMVENVRRTQPGTFDEVADGLVVRFRPGSLLRRAASVEEVASLVVYLASNQASATTGAAMRVDGGTIDSLV